MISNGIIAFPLAGLILGLALAVLHEMAGVVFGLRRLVLQFLRLLLPLLLLPLVALIILVNALGYAASALSGGVCELVRESGTSSS